MVDSSISISPVTTILKWGRSRSNRTTRILVNDLLWFLDQRPTTAFPPSLTSNRLSWIPIRRRKVNNTVDYNPYNLIFKEPRIFFELERYSNYGESLVRLSKLRGPSKIIQKVYLNCLVKNESVDCWWVIQNFIEKSIIIAKHFNNKSTYGTGGAPGKRSLGTSPCLKNGLDHFKEGQDGSSRYFTPFLPSSITFE